VQVEVGCGRISKKSRRAERVQTNQDLRFVARRKAAHEHAEEQRTRLPRSCAGCSPSESKRHAKPTIPKSETMARRGDGAGRVGSR